MPVYRFITTALPVIAAILPASAHADDAGADSLAAQITVTAALRTPVALDRVSSSVTLLDAAAIEQHQPVAVSDVLVRTPSINLSRNGGYGTATTIKIRGADSGQTVLVIDGMRLADPSSISNGYDFANLLVDDIARIEILRGPQSILWGSNALGGVVNVETVRPTKPLEGSFVAELGSNQTINGRAAVGGSSELVDWRIAGSAFTTDGISARSNGTEADSFSRHSTSGTATIHLSDTVSADVRGYYAAAHNQFDGFFGPNTLDYGRNQEWTVYAGLNAVWLDGKFKNRIAVLEGETKRETYDPTRTVRALNFDAKGKTRRYEYQGTYSFSHAAELVFGAEREELRSSNASPSDSNAPFTRSQSRANTNSFFGELRISPISGLTLNGGARWSDHSRFGSNTVFSGGAAWSLNGGKTVLRASYEEGYKAPSLYQLFSEYGSASLKPEKAHGWEVGIEQSLLADKLHTSATYFQRSTESLIAFASCPFGDPTPAICYIPGTTTPRFGYYENAEADRAHGLELAGDAQFGRFFIDANYSIVISENRTPGLNFGVQLPRVPRHLANGRIGYDFPFGLTTSVALRYSGKSFDDAIHDYNPNPAVLNDYVLADLRAEWKLLSGLSAYGRVENLFDSNYETAQGYSTYGRTVTLGIRSRF